MEDWQAELLSQVKETIKDDPFWSSYFGARWRRPEANEIHLAVFVEPYLSFILDGRKTMDSRFSSHLRPPHRRVKKGDVLLLKKSGGAVVGICRVSYVWFYTLDPESLSLIHSKFGDALCADGPDFWKERETKSFATLMKIDQVLPLGPLSCGKKDRRGWVVIRSEHKPRSLFQHGRREADSTGNRRTNAHR